MTDTEVCRIAIDWIRYNVADRNSQEQFDTALATTRESDIFLKEQYEDLWQLIEMIFSLDRSVTILGRLAAGPIEGLLGARGESYIDRVEEKARNEPLFAMALAGVWRDHMSEAVWIRVQGIADHAGLNRMYKRNEPINLPWGLRTKE